MLTQRHLIDIFDFSTEEVDSILRLSQLMIKSPSDFSTICNGKIMGTLFFEPSTRTRLSFESAMLRLGGQVLGFSDSSNSSSTKGETLVDTVQTVSYYSDLIVMRHPNEGSATLAQTKAKVPLINAGDGGHHHPTQTLTDLLTIQQTKDHLDQLTIGLCGDLKFGRTVHSLIRALSRYANNHFILISPKELQLPDYMMHFLNSQGISYEVHEVLEEVIDQLDVLYMTRVQKERFFNEADYIRLKDHYILTTDKLKSAKEDLAILHPLPRVNEISVEVDDDPRATYFDQVGYGVFVRMALIAKVLGVDPYDAH